MKKGIVLLLLLSISLFLASLAPYFTGHVASDSIGIKDSEKCKDSDMGFFALKKGAVFIFEKANVSNYTDYCNPESNGFLIEFYCYNGKLEKKAVACPYGCEEGKCNDRKSGGLASSAIIVGESKSYCSDGDNSQDLSRGGINVNEAGLFRLSASVSVYDLSDILVLDDYCVNNYTISESYCTRARKASRASIPCPKGYRCSKGRCI